MSQATAIEWTEATWNPVTGCDRVSPGCANCYALTLAGRLKAMGQARYQNDGGKSSGPGFAVTLHPDKLGEPLKRRKPTMYFVNSMSDLFHEQIPDEYIREVFEVMANAPQHTFQVLTKRPERMREWFEWMIDPDDPFCDLWGCQWPLPNVWLGVSIENRRFVHRADVLRETPAAVRFISAEPLLGPLVAPEGFPLGEWEDDYYGRGLDLDGIDWLIVGGESGPGHRPMDWQWARDLRDACFAVCGLCGSGAGGVWPRCRCLAERRRPAMFVKQLGGARPGTRLEDLPEDLRIREFPR